MSLPLPSDDPFLPILRSILDRNFPKTQLIKEVPAPVTSPLSFHDRHLGSRLTLKRVKIIPALHERLGNSILEHLEKFVSDGHKFDRSKYIRFSRDNIENPMEDAAAVGNEYDAIFGVAMVQLASKLFFTPDISDWITLLGFASTHYDRTNAREFLAEGCIGVNTSGSQLYLTMMDLAKLPKAAEIAALDLDTVYDWLTNWSFFPLTKRGKTIVSSMPSTTSFDWEYANTLGITAQANNLPIPPDALEGFAAREIQQYLAGRRKGAQEKQRQPSQSKKGDIRIPASQTTRKKYVPISKDYIQKAWSVAVREDTTYMIFNCGSHERIGIRDRASQTLYLSGLIETANSNPAYGRIQLGLFLAILQDATAREEARRQFNDQHNVSLKRSAQELDVDDETPPAKRQKSDEDRPPYRLANAVETYAVNQAEKEMARRNVLLLNLKYGNYDSPVPSSFIRSGTSCVRGLFEPRFKNPERQKSYDRTQYMMASLRSPIGRGAIGTAHRAVIDVFDPSSGKTLHYPCLIKLAFTTEAQKALEHEFSIYRHLAQRGSFSGVPRVHGLFRDAQSDTTALLMDFGGYSLRRRECELDPNFTGDYVFVEKNELDIVLEGFERLHQAGVCHNDVRIDNIVINDANEVMILDFDRAILTEQSMDHETEMDSVRDIVFYRHDSVSDTTAHDLVDQN